MNLFIKWIKEYWNELVDIVSRDLYFDIKNKYLIEINNEINLINLSTSQGKISVENNFVLLLLEKWLYRHASIYDIENKRMYREHSEARTALINRYLYKKEDGFFYDYDLKTNKSYEAFKPIDQYYAYWLGFSNNRKQALNLLKEVDNKNPMLFVVFMGLRRLGLIKEAKRIGEVIGYKVSYYNPRISTNTCPLLRYYSPEKSLELIKEAGFDTYDYSMESPNELFVEDDYLIRAKRLRSFADELGLTCNQTHAIFPVWHKTYDEKEVEIRTMYTKRILEISKILGGVCCVIHPINDFNEEQNCQYFRQFLPLAEKLEINIATENMWNWEGSKASLAACSNHDNFKKLLEMVNHPNFVACVDLGHAEMDGLNTAAPKMIENLGDYVKCLHIHDNDLHFDRHQLPFSEKIDFDLILDSLARIDYQGDITFECDGFLTCMPKELHLSSLRLMHKIGLFLKNELLIRRKAICLKK